MNEYLGLTNGRFSQGEHGLEENLNVYWHIGFPKNFKVMSHFAGMNLGMLWVVLDEHEDTIVAPAFCNFYPLPGESTTWFGMPTSRHGGAGTLSFGDGHVEVKRWTDSRTRKPVDGRYSLCIPCPNNPDKTWLDERTTELYNP
jgi:prepilin-type processing-associated H-X9-DG protein